MSASRIALGVAGACVAMVVGAGSAFAAQKPFTRVVDPKCSNNKTQCSAKLKLPIGSVINFVTCEVFTDVVLRVDLNIVGAEDESGFFQLLPPIESAGRKILSQSVSIAIPDVGTPYLILTGKQSGDPQCSISGFTYEN